MLANLAKFPSDDKPSLHEGQCVSVLQGKTALEVVMADMPEPVRYGEWIFEGVNLIAGRPKLGKTTLERQKMAALAEGGVLWGSRMPQIPVVFLCLEEGERLAKEKLLRAQFSREALANITMFFDWPRGQAGVRALSEYLIAHPDPCFVVIDSLAKFRAVPDKNMPVFMADYEALKSLHDALKAHPGVAVDVISHTRKMKAEDPIDEISGSYGLTAACDFYAVLRYTSSGKVTMHFGGRLWEQELTEFQLVKANHRWDMVGKDASSVKSDIQGATLLAIGKGGVKLLDLSRALFITKQAAYERVETLVNLGLAYKKDGFIHAGKPE
jgi:RecA-family ATPase